MKETTEELKKGSQKTKTANKDVKKPVSKASKTTKGTKAAKAAKASKGSSKGPSKGSRDGKGKKERLYINDLLGRTEQFSSIFTKGLDLAEASIRLGINLINKFGAVAQGQVIDRMAGAVFQGGASPFQQRTEDSGQNAPGYQNSDEAGIPQPPNVNQSLYIVNRLPLFPGSPVHISFSINNDSASAAKGLSLSVEDFIGATHGAKIPSGLFKISPSDIVIAPMDFEKFVLTGKFPADTPPDSYNSWIKVSGEEDIKIPVILAVSMKP